MEPSHAWACPALPPDLPRGVPRRGETTHGGSHRRLTPAAARPLGLAPPRGPHTLQCPGRRAGRSPPQLHPPVAKALGRWPVPLPGRVRPGPQAGLFPPLDRAIVVSIACEVVARTGTPLSRQSTTDLAKRAREELDKPISRTTVWGILDADAIRPWQYEHWLFPRASDFFTKAAVVLDLYEGYYQGERLDPFDQVLSSDEKTSIQARIRWDPTLEPGPERPRRVASKYKRGGALQYLAARDVPRGRGPGRCERRAGHGPVGRRGQQGT